MLKKLNRLQLAAVVFYTVSGILMLTFLPLSSYPPHLAFIGIISLITAYSLFTKRPWMAWLVFLLFVVNTAFALNTLISIGFSNLIVALSMIALAVLTWLATIYLLLKKRS